VNSSVAEMAVTAPKSHLVIAAVFSTRGAAG
jgi:hypothetical protein